MFNVGFSEQWGYPSLLECSGKGTSASVRGQKEKMEVLAVGVVGLGLVCVELRIDY